MRFAQRPCGSFLLPEGGYLTRFNLKRMNEAFNTRAAGKLPTFQRQMSMKRPQWFRLVQRRSVWCPTWFGALCMVALLVTPIAWWLFWGESYLSATSRLPTAEVLVVEGWIGEEGVRAAAAEFRQHGYRYVVATGCVANERWASDRWSYADVAERELLRLGIPRDRVITAPAGEVKRGRTYQSAVAAVQALRAQGIQPKEINIFTNGPHAARSRLVFAKVFGPETGVGAVDWMPSDYEPGPWWRSSERARELIVETAGYLFELVLNSGRGSSAGGSAPGVSREQAGRVSGESRLSCRTESKPCNVPGRRFGEGCNGTFWTAAILNP
jgi:uncharacterized SAM-binding protein YcdF (DUF218 family)